MSIPGAGIIKGMDNAVGSVVANLFNEKTGKIVRQHCIAAAAVSVAAAAPGAGATACVAAQTAVVYSMYIRINRALGIKISENKLKALASAVIGNIAANAATFLLSAAAATALSILPGAGSAASTLIMAGVGYATVTIAAMGYGAVLRALTKNGANADSMSASEMKNAVKEALSKRNLNRDMKDLINEYKRGRKNGEFTGKETIDLESM